MPQDNNRTDTDPAAANMAYQLPLAGSWALDHSANSLVWTDEIYRIFELCRTAIPSYDTFLSCVHPDDRACVFEAFRHSLATRSLYEVTHRAVMPDGRVKWVQESGKTCYNSNGEPTVSIGTSVDLTNALHRSGDLTRMAKMASLTPQQQSSVRALVDALYLSNTAHLIGNVVALKHPTTA